MDISKIINSNTPLIDPHSFSEISIVSHAHADHVALNPFSKPRIIICSHETMELITYRYRESNLFFIPLDYEAEYNLYDLIEKRINELKTFNFINNYSSDLKISIYPAGHVLGSSQILISNSQSSLLYTGDFKFRDNESCKNLVLPKDKNIDFLIMESTFAKPKYIFPSINEIKKDIIQFCNQSLDEGYIPIILAYSLGKSQEIIKLLEDSKLNIIVHGTIFNISEIYIKNGIDLKNFSRYKRENINSRSVEKRTVIIIPPHFHKNRMVTNIPNRKVAVATGWAVDNYAKYSHNADAAFPLSDHSDYSELICYVKAINPKKVLVTHGFALQLSKDLNKLGFNAEPLDTYNTNSLFPSL